MNNIICVVGPTASGKTRLSVALCRRYGGEVLSDIRRDLDGIESVSRRLGPDDCRNGFLGNMLSACLRLVAPLC